MNDTITTVELAKWFPEPEMPETARARLFGELVKRVAPIVENYVSDLFHDANYLTNHIKHSGDWFYYAIDEWGTHIGTSRHIFDHRKTAQYNVTIQQDKGIWSVLILDVTPEQE